MNKFQEAVISFIRETVRSNRWENENAPGSANLREVTSYEGVTEGLRAITDSEMKGFYLTITNDIGLAFNDDWLPNEVCALPLSSARDFLRDIWPIVEEHGLKASVQKIKECHATYRNAL